MLNIILDEEKSTVTLEPHGALTKEDFTLAVKKIDPLIEKLKHLEGLIIYVKDFPSWDSFSTLLTHFKFIRNHHKKIEKVVFVTDSNAIDFVKPIAKYFIHAEIKHFPYEELIEAKKWINKELEPA